MKKSIILFFVLLFHLSAVAQISNEEKIEDAKIKIIKATVEFLATDKETFKDVKEEKCISCKGYEELIAFTLNNNIKKADDLVRALQKVKIDTSSAKWKSNLVEFKNGVISKITVGPKAKRKNFKNYSSYTAELDSIINGVSIIKPVAAEEIIDEAKDTISMDEEVAPNASVAENPQESSGYLEMLPNISKLMANLIMFLLFSGVLYLLWLIKDKNKALDKKNDDLKEKLIKIKDIEWQSTRASNELQDAVKKLKSAQEEIIYLQENLKLESDRNQRLNAITEVQKTTVQAAPPIQATEIKYARYADQGDGFSVQELLNEEDGETIFELIISSPNSATYKISNNQSAQKYALSNSAYFLGKTSQYETFPSSNSIIYTDIPGELKLQGNKWLIVKPAQIRFS